jgi:hypothetical protein
LLDINELASLTQEIYIDDVLQDSKTVWVSNVTPLVFGGLWTKTIGEYAIGEEWATDTSVDDDYNEIYILRTKGNLNKKWKKFQFVYTNNTLAWKVRLKNLTAKVEVMPEIATSLTA